MLRVGPLITLPALIRQLGHDPEPVLAEAGMSLQSLSDPDHRLPYAARCRLLAVCRDRFDCPHFGLLLGQQVDLWHLGMLGVLLRSARNVEEALTNLVRYQAFHTQKDMLRMVVDRHSAQLSFRDPFVADGSAQVGDAILAGLCALLRALCGARWAPTQVFFAHHAPRDATPYSEYFNCPAAYSSDHYALSFPPHWLKKEIADVGAGLLQVVTREVEKSLIAVEACVVSTIRAAVDDALAAGNAATGPIAARLGVPVRTMHRHLEQQGFSFRQLLDEARFKAATLGLADHSRSICSVAESLGYAETASFTRAFRRWSGKTPSEWRRTAGR